MKKPFAIALVSLLIVSLLAGCAGTTVVINECTCPAGHVDQTPAPQPVGEGAVKTGLYITANAQDSKSAAGEENGEVKYDVTVVAVNVDEDGVITDCIIDSLGASVKFDAAGCPVDFDPDAPVLTKNELGENYGMVAWGGAVAEWDAQAAALSSFAVGKTVEELKNGAVDESGYAPDGSDLASTATIYLGGYVSAIEAAVANAQHLGAQAEDTLKLAIISRLDASPAQETGGAAELNMDVTALTVSGETITSCVIDALQAQVKLDGTGAITSELTFATKNMLGENYGMKLYGNAIAEWDAQAAAFAAYVTGKTGAEVAGIAVSETTKPADGSDLASSVTISIGGFQALIAKALG